MKNYLVGKQKIEIVSHINNGTVVKIDNSSVLQPEIKFNHGTVKWFEDKKRGCV